MPEHFVVTSLLHVEDLAFQGQNRLEASIAPLLGGSPCGLTFDQIDLASLSAPFRAVGELARQTSAVERTLAASKIARLARRLACPGSFNGFVDDAARYRRVLLQECAQTLVDERLHDAGDIGVEFAFGLPLELRLRQLYAHHSNETFANIVSRKVLFQVLE